MKNYIICLRNAQCVDGTMEEEEADLLLQAFYNHKKSWANSIYTFTDVAGTVSIDLDEVAAIGINDVIPTNKLGF